MTSAWLRLIAAKTIFLKYNSDLWPKADINDMTRPHWKNMDIYELKANLQKVWWTIAASHTRFWCFASIIKFLIIESFFTVTHNIKINILMRISYIWFGRSMTNICTEQDISVEKCTCVMLYLNFCTMKKRGEPFQCRKVRKCNVRTNTST